MKRLVVLVGCCVFLLAVAGCGRQNEKISGQPQLESESWESAFPEVMVGVWEVVVNEYSGSKWGIKFEPDGSISKIIHSLAGPVDVVEGGAYAERDDSYYVFVMGPCEANYEPQTGMLKVEIIVDHYTMKIPAGVLEGRIEDYIEGPVSEDGKTWRAKWVSLGWLEGSDPPPIDILKANPTPLVFTKVDLSQIKQEHKHKHNIQ